MGHNKITFANLCKFNCLGTFIFLCLILASNFIDSAHATTQGKLGKQSVGTVEISITVNKTFKATSPSELILKNTATTKNADKLFCVSHQGFSQSKNVPYDLIVDEIMLANQKHALAEKQALPFDIYLENKSSTIDKQILTPGMSISMISKSSISGNVENNCVNNDMHFSLGPKPSIDTSTIKPNTVGLLLLVVSPN